VAADSEFNLATPKELFSYGEKRNNLVLNEVQNLAKIKCNPAGLHFIIK